MIDKPYLLFLADAQELSTAKTASGIAHWRPEDCVGEFAYDDCSVSTGQPRLTLAEAVAAGAKTFVLGVANSGGFFERRWIETITAALAAGLDVASGMHMRLADQPAIAAAAQRSGRRLHDVRRPPADLEVGDGRPRSGRRVLTVGTDCSVGKMFTALALERELRARGVDATFRATGQTGILIAGSGIAVDAVVADFVSGAAERLAPANDALHWDLIEGQGSLFHPSFAAVSLGLLHGAQADRLVMCHDPARVRMRGDVEHTLPDLRDCIRVNEALARLTNPEAVVVGIALNTSRLSESAAGEQIRRLTDDFGMPVCDPVRTGVAGLADAVLR